MFEDGIPAEEWPSDDAIKHQRKTFQRPSHPSAACIANLHDFLEKCPSHIKVIETSITDKHCRIAFTTVHGQAFAKNTALSGMLCDFTFKTNVEGLLLGAAGPVGLKETKLLPHMRWVPTIFLLAHREDTDAKEMLLRLATEQRSESNGKYTHGFFDCAIYTTALSYFSSDFQCFRDVQHVKGNIKGAAKAKEDGKIRVRCGELRAQLIDWVEFTFCLEKGPQFQTFWGSALDRMEHNRCMTDFNVPLMAASLRKNILALDEPPFMAPWCTGYGCAPRGFTGYAVNCIESAWRALKKLLDPSFKWHNIADLILELSSVVCSKFENGHYKDLISA